MFSAIRCMCTRNFMKPGNNNVWQNIPRIRFLVGSISQTDYSKLVPVHSNSCNSLVSDNVTVVVVWHLIIFYQKGVPEQKRNLNHTQKEKKNTNVSVELMMNLRNLQLIWMFFIPNLILTRHKCVNRWSFSFQSIYGLFNYY